MDAQSLLILVITTLLKAALFVVAFSPLLNSESEK